MATFNPPDLGLMPHNRVNFSTFPTPQQELITGVPSAADLLLMVPVLLAVRNSSPANYRKTC